MRVVMWSGPRNLSTALMRAFGERADTEVRDEPFYAAYLAATGLRHPMRAAVIADGETDPRAVAASCAAEPAGRPVRYEKHMTHHMLPGWDLGWTEGARCAFLVRDPREVAASYAARRTAFAPEELGLPRQVELFERVAERDGAAPPVIDAREVRRAPEATLRGLCGALGLDFDPAMLRWPAGRRPTDGVWAAHWYGSVERSTGFAPPDGATPRLDPGLEAAMAPSVALYERLRAFAIPAQ